MLQRLGTPDVSEEADFDGPFQRFSPANDTGLEPVASRAPDHAFRGEDAHTQDRGDIDPASHDPARSELGPLLGRLAASQAGAPEAARPGPAVGAPRLAPDSIREEDPVLKELDKLIARLDADDAAARAARRSAPPKFFR